jgi:proteasome lid subunit RPN8/RPN11
VIAEPAAVQVRQSVLDGIAAHATAEWPNECCGLLIGTAHGIEAIHRSRNELESPTRYRINPADHFTAVRLARHLKLSVVGAYHSHPSASPTPSAVDLAEADPGDFLYLIAGPCDAHRPAVLAWRVVEGNFLAVPLVTLP